MKIIFFFRAILSDFLIYLLMLILGVAFAPFAACSRRLACESVRIYCLSCFIVLKYVAKITVEFRGEVPKKNVIICAKHMSFLDILMLAYILPRPRFVMKKELKWAPILGFYALRLGCSPVSRGKKGGAIVSLKKNINANRNLGDGQTIIYPQGTRVLPGVKAPYKVGAGVIYRDQNLPCVFQLSQRACRVTLGNHSARRSFRTNRPSVTARAGEIPRANYRAPTDCVARDLPFGEASDA